MSVTPAQKPLVCPYLGAWQDPTTFYDYPSPGNYCHRLETPGRPANLHQEEFCLSGRHAQCPVFAAGRRPIGVEKDTFLPTAAPARLGGRVPWWWVVLAVMVIGGGVGLALAPRRPGAAPPAPTMLSATAAAAGMSSPTLAPSATLRPTTGATLSPTPPPTATPTATRTATPRPSPMPTPTPTPLPSPTLLPTPVARARLTEPLGLNVRRGPSLYYPIVTRLTDTTLELTVTGRDAASRWWQVCCVTPAGVEGWVSAEYITLSGPAELAPVITEPPLPALTTIAYVNLRRGPGTAYPLVQIIPPEVAFGVIGRTAASEWWQVCCWTGQPGWLSTGFVTFIGDTAAVPIVADAPAP